MLLNDAFSVVKAAVATPRCYTAPLWLGAYFSLFLVILIDYSRDLVYNILNEFFAR